MREVQEFTTKSGVKVEFKTYLIGREMDEWRSLFLEYLSTDIKGKIETEKISGKVLADMEKKAISLAIYSVNGKSDKVLDLVLDLPISDYREIADKALEIMEKAAEFFAGKKK